MRLTKLGSVVASLAVALGTTAVLTATPAHAATATKAKLTINSKKNVKTEYGSFLSFDGSVTASGGGTVTGTVTLDQRLPGKKWKTIATDTDAGFVFFDHAPNKAKGTAQFRLHYEGDGTNAATTSNIVTLGVLWNLHDSSACPGGKCHISGKLGPKAKHHKILVQVKRGGWKKFKVLHTNKKSKYKVRVPGSAKGTHYRIIVSKSKSILATKKSYTVTRV